MKPFTISIIMVLLLQGVYCQDIITKINSEKIIAKVNVISKNDIKYRKYNNLDGPQYIIDKTEILQLQFEDGSIEYYKDIKANTGPDLEETKSFIKEHMDKFAFEEDNFKRRCRVTFEDDYLRLNILKRDSEEAVNDGLLYDFSRVHSFHDVSDRKNKAFINIIVFRQTNEKKDLWDKHKMIVRIKEVEVAQSIVNALKHYNKLLLEKEKNNRTTKF